MNRTESQEKALFVIYDILLYAKWEREVDLEWMISGICDAPYEKVNPFVKEMAIAAIKCYHEAIPLYQSHMENWTFDRLNNLEQALLILSYCQYHFDAEKPDKKIIINVAVNLAKKYLDAKDYRFVNAILDKVLA